MKVFLVSGPYTPLGYVDKALDREPRKSPYRRIFTPMFDISCNRFVYRYPCAAKNDKRIGERERWYDFRHEGIHGQAQRWWECRHRPHRLRLYHRAAQREQAQKHLTIATTMYRDMGMTYWLEKAEAEVTELA
jgi:hypothetical protein